MPAIKRTKRVKVVRGEGIKELLSAANNFIKKNKFVSRSVRSLAPLTGSFSPVTHAGADWIASKGYGKRGCGLRQLNKGLLK